jgi:hypothetical protein
MPANIRSTSTINGLTEAGSVASLDSAEFALVGSASTTYKVNTILVSNQADSDGLGGNALVNVEFRTLADSAYNFINDIEVPMKTTLDVLGSSIYINNGERLAVLADSSELTVLVSYESLT